MLPDEDNLLGLHYQAAAIQTCMCLAASNEAEGVQCEQSATGMAAMYSPCPNCYDVGCPLKV